MGAWPIDPRNLGEVLACAGLAHLAWRADGEARTGFERDAKARIRFVAPDGALPCEGPALERLAGRPCELLRFAGVELDWWCPWGLNPGLKQWSGQQTAWTVHRNVHRALGHASASQWLTHAVAVAGGRLYLDPDGTWDALSLGWSLDLQWKAHRGVRMRCRPWVELLGSVGLQAFPVAGSRASGFPYTLWRRAPLSGAVAAFAGAFSPAYALERFHVATARHGSNTVLRRATPLPMRGSASTAH